MTEEEAIEFISNLDTKVWQNSQFVAIKNFAKFSSVNPEKYYNTIPSLENRMFDLVLAFNDKNIQITYLFLDQKGRSFEVIKINHEIFTKQITSQVDSFLESRAL